MFNKYINRENEDDNFSLKDRKNIAQELSNRVKDAKANFNMED